MMVPSGRGSPPAQRTGARARSAPGPPDSVAPRGAHLRSLGGPRHNLPAELTSFVGREREVAEVAQLLDTARLVTLTGAPGVGKTRLALRVGAELAGALADGVWLVQLATLADPALVPRAVAGVLGVREQPHRPLDELLARAIGRRKLLLVLDNCEHLVEGCAGLAEHLLQACPELRVLATSREALRVAGEVARPVPPLSAPDASRLPSRGDELVPAVAEYEAVRLFVERARGIVPSFALTADNAHAVAGVCHRLDGLPLALELAAARVTVLSPSQMADRLADRFHLLTTGSRTALPRHRTLRALVDWSHDLLAEPERVLFRRLSVFAGGWTLEAAELVTGDGSRVSGDVDSTRPSPTPVTRHPSPALDVLEGLGELVDHSLVRRQDEAADGARFGMLETIRQYAAERLEGSGEAEALRRRHAEHFLALAEQAEPELLGPRQGTWLERLGREHDNLRAALGWALERGEAELGLRLAGALGRFWEVRGHLSEGQRWLERALSRCTGASAAAQAGALSAAGNLAFVRCDYDPASALHEASLALRQELGDRSGIATSLHNLSRVRFYQGDHEQAEALCRESLALRRELGDRRGIAMSLNTLGVLARNRRDHAAARAAYEESLALFRALGDTWGVSLVLNNLARVARDDGDWEETAALCAESLALFRELGDRHGIAWVLSNLAIVAQRRGASGRAAQLFGAAEALSEAIGSTSLSLSPAERTAYEAAAAAARAKLGDATFAAAHSAGRAMPLEQAIEFALGTDDGRRTTDDRREDSSSVVGRPSSVLTRREREVAALVARGLTNREIAEELVIAKLTADRHVANILSKLGLDSRTQLALWAADHGLHPRPAS